MSGPPGAPGVLDEARLDDPAGMAEVDAAQMLRAVATSAAQVRMGVTAATEAGVVALAAEGRPRAVVVTGMGGSAMAGEVLAALAGTAAPVPVVLHRGYGLPLWVGAADLVVAVSCSGTTEETLSATVEAAGRSARLVAVGAADSALADVTRQARGLFVPVDGGGRMPRANLWALATPLVLLGDAVGLFRLPATAVEAAAARLADVAVACRPDSPAFVNPAKALALALAGTVPMIWGTSPVTGLAAQRMAAQLAENAKAAAIAGVLPEANHNQVVALDGPLGAGAASDLFADRVDGQADLRLRLVLLRDVVEHPQVAARAGASAELAAERGVPVTELAAEGDSDLERLASLVGLLDFASVYLALLTGIDPSPIPAISELKDRIRR